MLHTKRLSAALALLVLTAAGCTTSPPPNTDQITWYAVNTGSSLRIVLYDLVCDRMIGSLRLSGRRETPVSTCSDTDGRAYVRYRPYGYASRIGGYTYSRINENQRVYVQ